MIDKLKKYLLRFFNEKEVELISSKNIIYVEKFLFDQGLNEEESLDVIQIYNDTFLFEVFKLLDNTEINEKIDLVLTDLMINRHCFKTCPFKPVNESNSSNRNSFKNLIYSKKEDFIFYTKAFQDVLMLSYIKDVEKKLKKDTVYYLKNKEIKRITSLETLDQSHNNKDGFFIFTDTISFEFLWNGKGADRYEHLLNVAKCMASIKNEEPDLYDFFIQSISLYLYDQSIVQHVIDKAINTEDKKELFHLLYKDGTSSLWKYYLSTTVTLLNQEEISMLSKEEHILYNDKIKTLYDNDLENLLNEVNEFVSNFDECYNLEVFKIYLLQTEEFKYNYLRDLSSYSLEGHCMDQKIQSNIKL